MQLVDTHTHIYLPEFDADRDEAVARAARSGVSKLFMPNIDADSIESMLDAEKRYKGTCLPMIGLHPTSVKEDYLTQLQIIEKTFDEHRFIGIGEIGIDLFWDKTFIREQVTVFRNQLLFSLEKDLPAIIHSRNSFQEVFSVLDEFRGKGLKGVLHAFTGGFAEMDYAVNLGFKLGIGGIVTFKNSGLDKIVKATPVENIILETDSPYLAPVPYRGKRNESSYICIINKKIADIKGMKEEDVAAATYSNSMELFKLKE